MSVEALYTMTFGDNVAPAAARNGGVVVLETGRVFGGDSSFSYVGTYRVVSDLIQAEARIERYNDLLQSAFGDDGTSFKVWFVGKIVSDQKIVGYIERPDMLGQRVGVTFNKKAELRS